MLLRLRLSLWFPVMMLRCVNRIMAEDRHLKDTIASLQEPAENTAVKVEVAPPVTKDDVPLPATNGDDHPGEKLVGPVEEKPTVAVPGVST